MNTNKNSATISLKSSPRTQYGPFSTFHPLYESSWYYYAFSNDSGSPNRNPWSEISRAKNHFILETCTSTKLTDDDIPRVLAIRASFVLDQCPGDQDVLPAPVALGYKLW